jgi:hypothetical protein
MATGACRQDSGVTCQHHRYLGDGAPDRNAIWDQALDWPLSLERAPDGAALRARLTGWLARGQAERRAFA